MRWATLGLVLAGCLHPKSHACEGNGETWVCPEELACAAAPTYCGTIGEVGACEGKLDRDPCSTALVPDGQCLSGVCNSCSNDIAGCRYVGWNSMTSDNALDLDAVAFSDFGEAYAAGKGVMLRYDISRWATDDRFPTPALPANTPIKNLVAVGARVFAFANNTVYVLDSGTWTSLPMVAAPYNAMWVAPTGEVFLVGSVGRVARYDGTWSETTAAVGSLVAVWGTSATDVYAAGFTAANSALAHFDGTSWTPVPGIPNVGGFATVWATGGEVFAASATTLVHGVGATFTTTPAPNAFAIWGSSTTDVFAVGGSGVIRHWDGGAWTTLHVTSSSDLRAIAGSSAAEIFAVGVGGTIQRYTGAAWADLATQPGASQLHDLWVAGPGEVFAVGNPSAPPTIFHWQNNTWQSEMPSPQVSAPPVTVWGRTATDAVAVGQLSAAARQGSTAWANVSAGAIGIPVDTWGNATTIYAVGEQVVAFNGTTWTALTTVGENNLTGVWVAPSGRVWLTGKQGIAHLEGSTIAYDVPSIAFNSIWGAGEADVFAVGGGDIRHFDGTSWTQQASPTTGTLSGVWGRAADDAFAVGAGATMLHYHAGSWRQFASPYSGDFTAVSGSGDAIYATSSDGMVRLLIDTAP